MRYSLPVFVALAACGPGSPETQAVLTTPSTTQIAAQEACHSEILGRVIPQAIQVLELDSGGASVYTVNGRDISLGQARSINQCARNKVLSGQIADTTPVVRTSAQPGQDLPHATAPRSFAATPFCPQDASVIYGGTQYCIKR